MHIFRTESSRAAEIKRPGAAARRAEPDWRYDPDGDQPIISIVARKAASRVEPEEDELKRRLRAKAYKIPIAALSEDLVDFYLEPPA